MIDDGPPPGAGPDKPSGPRAGSGNEQSPPNADPSSAGSPTRPADEGGRTGAGQRERLEPEEAAPGGKPGQAAIPVDPDRPCMNCGNPAPGEYCSSCGQRKVNVRVSVWALIMDVLEDQFILDKRLPRTLGTLFFRPGRLTVEHVNGRIVRYIHPFRLYLVSSLMFFLILSFTSLQLVRRALDEDAEEGVAVATTEQSAALDRSIAALEETLASTDFEAEERDEALERLAELQSERQALRADSLSLAIASLDSALTELDKVTADSSVPGPVRGALEANRDLLERRREVAMSQRATLIEETAVDTLIRDEPEERSLDEMFGWDEDPPTMNSVGPPAVDSVVHKQLRRLGAMTPREAAETLTATFFDYVPIMMFVLLPVFAAVLKLLYIRRRRYYAEHFVFLLHVHSFVFFLATVMLLLRGRAAGWVEVALAGWLLIYIYIAMMRVYGQGWIKTFLKYWTLGWMYFWILLASAAVVFVVALLLF